MNLAVVNQASAGGVSRQVASKALRIFDWLELRGQYTEFDGEMRQAHQALREELVKGAGHSSMSGEEWSELRRLASAEYSAAAGSLAFGGAPATVPAWAQLVAKLESNEEIPVMNGSEVSRMASLSYEAPVSDVIDIEACEVEQSADVRFSLDAKVHNILKAFEILPLASDNAQDASIFSVLEQSLGSADLAHQAMERLAIAAINTLEQPLSN